ncbi:hypothetical protein FACS189443_3140 [Planctomycetales bacterium]|nr:hypothetical protein FACS189443_3140 [Planctomycetales bacterium]
MKNFTAHLLTLLIITLFVTGCGKSISVGGKVVFSDGEPLGTGKVVFEDGKNAYRGKINEDGTFSLGQLKDGEGIPPGRYQVYVAEAWRFEPDNLNQIELVNVKYRRKDTSEIAYEITGKRTDIVITVEKPAKPKGINKQPKQLK